jgi:hypothetical protein
MLLMVQVGQMLMSDSYYDTNGKHVPPQYRRSISEENANTVTSK